MEGGETWNGITMEELWRPIWPSTIAFCRAMNEAEERKKSANEKLTTPQGDKKQE